MLQSFRDNTQSIVIKIVIGFIIITFALFGVDSLIGLTGQPSAPVTVNGVDISERQIQDGIELQRRQLLAQMGENADPSLLDDNLLRGAVIQNLIERELLKQAAEEQGMKVSDQFLDAAILATREFQVDGQFDRNQFEAMLRNVGMTPMMYRDYLRNETVVGQGRNGLVASAFLLPQELDRIAALDRQQRGFSYLEFSVDEELKKISINEADIKARYDSNPETYRSEEQVAVEYVELNKQELAKDIEVDEAELQSQYDRLVSEFEGAEARRASHILITINDQRNEAEALEKTLELMKQIDAGTPFAEIARNNSEDPGSAADGGDLGFVEKGIMVPEFEEALFALQEGEISEPVRTDFGYHLIQLNKIERSTAPTFDEVRDQLAQEQRLQKAESIFVAKSEELDDLRFSASDLLEASEVLGLEIKTTEFFGREGGASALSQAPRFLAAAFSEDVLVNGENSELIELDADRVLVVHLKEHRPVRTLALAEVRDQIEAELKREEAAKRVMAQASEVLKKAETEGFDAVAGEYEWTDFEAVGRGDASVAREVVTALFKMARPNNDGVTLDTISLADGGAAVVALRSVDADTEQLDETQRQRLNDFLATRMGQSDYRDFVAHLKSTAEIEQL